MQGFRVFQARIFCGGKRFLNYTQKKESHKKIIIGKKGKTIKNIGIIARKDMQKFLNKKVNLFIRVKIKQKCLTDPVFFKSLGLGLNA